ncbi:GNAT family N-acetyltransferase [Achromobacter xylosoxidans]
MSTLPPAFRRLASSNLAAQFSEQIARGAARLYLYALEGNTRAIAFYERQGWQYTGSEIDRIGGIEARARRYVRPL